MYGSYGGFEYAAREARRELLEEARTWRLARLARSTGPSLRERFGRVVRSLVGLLASARLRARVGGEIPIGGTPTSVYLVRGEGGEPDRAVEVYAGEGGRVVRRTDLLTGASTDSFLVDGRVRR